MKRAEQCRAFCSSCGFRSFLCPAIHVLAASLGLSGAAASRVVAQETGQTSPPQIAPVSAKAYDSTITVEQFERKLAGLRGQSDRDVAREIARLELSERLSTIRLQKLTATLSGKRLSEALMAVADASAFLDLPVVEQLKLPMPDRTGQREIFLRASDFVARTVSKMPDFFATKTTTRFQKIRHFKISREPVIVLHPGFQFIDRSAVTSVYRDGNEEEETPKKKSRRNVSSIQGLYNSGIFGPLLADVMTDVLKGRVGWSHWEQSVEGPAAVFRFAVPEDGSTYNVRFCCIADKGSSPSVFQATPAYHGEIAINPDTGAILRIVLKTDLKPGIELRRMDLVVDYAPVSIGGKSFICPVKSVSLANVLEMVKRPAPTANGARMYKLDDGPLITAINDIQFDNYHQFRSEMKILPFDESTTPPQ